jgi:murein L,D-transpeptidase YcbB/YkuD
MIAAELRDKPAEDPLMRMYAPSGYVPLWLASKEGVRRQRDLAEAATLASAQGIETTHLSQLLLTASARNIAPAAAAHADIALTRETLKLANAIRLGVVPRKELGRSWLMPADEFDAMPGLAAALQDKGGLKSFFADLAPQDSQFNELIAALQTYRDIVERGGWPKIPADKELKLGTDDPRTAFLVQRLAAEGYLRSSSVTDVAALTEAVKAFQTRNGLEPDGRLGRGTLAALNVPAEERVLQIAANLERWRQTPRDRGDTFIAVNTASTTLDYVSGGA